MGTVGLSFGSPTSGAGFDVSAAVTSMVSNLQKVEQPWKDQLSLLQSQDTVLSSLGTLFWSLSDDVAALTDFEGVLAQKTGSSSNTNALVLTSASSIATAGTHSIAVNSLATTASGYLDPIPAATDTISGTISISLNGAAAQTFDVSTLAVDSQTLNGLATAINKAGIGVTASILSDSKGSRLSLVSNTPGDAGQMAVTSTIADPKLISATNPTGTAAYHQPVDGKDASLNIDGVDLTSSSNTVTSLIPGVTFQLLSPTASSSNVQVVIGNYNSGIETAVSKLVADYNSVMTALNAQEGNDSSGKPQPLFGSPTVSLLQQQIFAGLNTQSPNGSFSTILDPTDILSGSIDIKVGNGTSTTMALPSGGGTLADLASAINSANLGVTANVISDKTGSRLAMVSNTTGPAGRLTVSASITDTKTNTAMNYIDGNTDINSLGSLGISLGNDGKLALDSSKLDSALNSDFQSVVGFFQNADSWGQTFNRIINNAGNSSHNGALKLAQNANASVEKNLNNDISREEKVIAARQASLTDQLNKANEILQALPSQIESMNMLYAAITGYNQKG